MLGCVAEHVVVEERYERAERCECQYGIGVKPGVVAYTAIESTCYRREAGGESVYAVYEVYRVCDEDCQQQSEDNCNRSRERFKTQKTVEIVKKRSTDYYQS